MSAPTELALVVSHTHWDREWYKTAEAFRIGLVQLIDELLDRDDDAPFLLDGQAILLEDYLAWRPERRADLARALAQGRLEAGPWFVLGDNLIPGGEALVRNLLAGRSVLRSLRAPWPPVLYCPDSFGHPAVAPVLAHGFGLQLAVVWRGYGGRLWPPGDTARWRHDSGSEVLLHHLPPDGYEFGNTLPTDERSAAIRWKTLHDVLSPRSSTGALLVLNGADHHALQADLGSGRAALGRAAAPVPVAPASLTLFGLTVRELVAARRLPRVRGELRASPDYTWSLQGTFGSRASHKRGNAELERLLVRHVEPWASLLAWRDGDSHAFATRALWRLVLSNHPHDTLCGCSVDDVAAAMNDRMRRARSGVQELHQKVIGSLAGRNGAHETALLIANPAPRARGGVIEADLDVVLAPVPVGPGSHQVAQSRQASALAAASPGLPGQVLSTERAFTRDEDPRRYPRNTLVERRRVLVHVPAIPAFGLQTFPLKESPARRSPAAARVRVRDGRLTNGEVSLWVDRQHGLCLEANGRVFRDILELESEGERGDLYTHSPIPATQQVGRMVRSRITMRGPLRGAIRLTWQVPISARELTSATGEAIRHRPQALTLTTEAQLDAGRSWARVIVEGDNAARDFRLRLRVRTGASSAVHVADAAFGRVLRSSRPILALPDDVERIPPTAPLHRYVSIVDDATGGGATLFSDGLAEYEATENGEIAVTLLRAVGELSRNDLAERPGHAGWPSPTPAAQCEGPFAAAFAFLPHGPLTEDTITAIEEVAEDFLVPPSGWTLPRAAAAGQAKRGLELEGRGLRFESCKESEEGHGLIVRCTNLLDRPVAGSWSLAGVTSAFLCRLDETPLGALVVAEGRVEFQVPPFAVSTMRLSRGEEGPARR